jgi:hypothetical protein
MPRLSQPPWLNRTRNIWYRVQITSYDITFFFRKHFPTKYNLKIIFSKVGICVDGLRETTIISVRTAGGYEVLTAVTMKSSTFWSCLFHTGFLIGFLSWRWRRYVRPKRLLASPNYTALYPTGQKPSYSPLWGTQTHRLFWPGSMRQAVCVMPVSCLAYYSILKIEATCSSETSADFHRTTQRHIPEDRILQYSRRLGRV